MIADGGGVDNDSSLGVDTVHDSEDEMEMVSGINGIESFFSNGGVDIDVDSIGVCRQFKKYACSAE